MAKDSAIFIKTMTALCWMFIASYYFVWGDNEVTVVDPVDESGWVSDGALAASITHT